MAIRTEASWSSTKHWQHCKKNHAWNKKNIRRKKRCHKSTHGIGFLEAVELIADAITALLPVNVHLFVRVPPTCVCVYSNRNRRYMHQNIEIGETAFKWEPTVCEGSMLAYVYVWYIHYAYLHASNKWVCAVNATDLHSEITRFEFCLVGCLSLLRISLSFLVRSRRLSFFFGGVRWDCVHLVRRPLIGLVNQPRMIHDDECAAIGEKWELARDTEVLRENLPQCHYVNHKSHMTWPGLEHGPPRWEAGD
jgi:hypothetical protein